MAQYKIAIPTGDGTTTGGYVSGGSNFADFVVDRGVSRKPQFRILRQQFGDGYEQRLRDGINTKEEMYDVTFNNRQPEEIYAIADFFDDVIPESFDFYIDNDIVRVFTDTYSIIHQSTVGHSLTVSLKRVYEV